MPVLLLGTRVRDNQTGYEGIATARIDFHTGCSHYIVESTKLKADGSLVSSYQFDPQRLLVLEKPAKNYGVIEPSIELWAMARDEITGFSGFVSAVKASLYGPPQICIEPDQCNPDGELNMPEWFFEARVIAQLIEKEVLSPSIATIEKLRPLFDSSSPDAPFGRDENGEPFAPFGLKPNGGIKRSPGPYYQYDSDPDAPFGRDDDGEPIAPFGRNWRDKTVKKSHGGPSPYGSGIIGVR